MFKMDEERFEMDREMVEIDREGFEMEEEMFETNEEGDCDGYEEREDEIGPDGEEAKGLGRDGGKQKRNKPDDEGEGASELDDKEARLGEAETKDEEWSHLSGSR